MYHSLCMPAVLQRMCGQVAQERLICSASRVTYPSGVGDEQRTMPASAGRVAIARVTRGRGVIETDLGDGPLPRGLPAGCHWADSNAGC